MSAVCPRPRDAARVLAAHPDVLVEAAALLEAMLARCHLDGGTLSVDLPPWLADRLAAWGAELEDVEAEP